MARCRGLPGDARESRAVVLFAAGTRNRKPGMYEVVETYSGSASESQRSIASRPTSIGELEVEDHRADCTICCVLS
jgi:hypothetical protein